MTRPSKMRSLTYSAFWGIAMRNRQCVLRRRSGHHHTISPPTGLRFQALGRLALQRVSMYAPSRSSQWISTTYRPIGPTPYPLSSEGLIPQAKLTGIDRTTGRSRSSFDQRPAKESAERPVWPPSRPKKALYQGHPVWVSSLDYLT